MQYLAIKMVVMNYLKCRYMEKMKIQDSTVYV